VTSTLLIVMSGSAGLAIVLLLYLVLQSDLKTRTSPVLETAGEPARAHVTHLSVIRRAMSEQDLSFLESRADAPAVRRAHQERRQIAILYVLALRSDFQRLLRLARIVALMSPEVAAAHELERLRLIVMFTLRYELLMAGLRLGWLFMPTLGALIGMLSELALRMEASMLDLGERSLVAMELASTLDRRSLDAA
jgi:hypothetical protein